MHRILAVCRRNHRIVVSEGGAHWLTVGVPGEGAGVELLLEPAGHPAVAPFTKALVADGVPFTSFAVDSVEDEYQRLMGLGVAFTQPPTRMGPITTAVFSDTVGNLIQIADTAD